MEEIWKPIQNYGKFYEISNLGNIKSHIASRGYHKYGNGRKSITMNPWLKTDGYFVINLYIPNMKGYKTRFIHRLVAQHFVQNIDNKPQVNHIY